MPPTETPYAWCLIRDARPGDRVLICGLFGRVGFTIDAIDHEAKRVTWSMQGIWTNREWIAMDPRATYRLEKAGEKASVE